MLGVAMLTGLLINYKQSKRRLSINANLYTIRMHLSNPLHNQIRSVNGANVNYCTGLKC